MSDVIIAMNRFGLGARPGDAMPNDPERWLLAQFDRYDPAPPPIANGLGHREIMDDLAGRTRAIIAANRAVREAEAEEGGEGGETINATQARQQLRRDMRRASRVYHRQMVAARVAAALQTDTPFAERLVHFWANHFAVSVGKNAVIALAGRLEFDAIRPHIFGRFEDMLLAAEAHPAMLFYLDQTHSAGPNSPFGTRTRERRRRPLGFNENLAREIMELHTLGAGGGYDQRDVTEFARALTGWTTNGLVTTGYVRRFLDPDAPAGSPAFVSELHEPGARQVMGRRYDQQGVEQGRAILRDLARHPSTARHLATKLARHFAGDDPPPALIDRLAGRYAETGGDLAEVYRALIDAPEAWTPEPVKFKTPWEWQISAMRGIGSPPPEPGTVVRIFDQIGQPVWEPESPAGYDDVAGRWAVPDALVRRVERAGAMAQAARNAGDPRRLAETLFADRLSETTARTIAQAESDGQGLALLLVSPEMQRR